MKILCTLTVSLISVTCPAYHDDLHVTSASEVRFRWIGHVARIVETRNYNKCQCLISWQEMPCGTET